MTKRTQKTVPERSETRIPSDAELWNDILLGSSIAWSHLIRRYQNLVYAVAARSGLSYADASDCFQQTWVLLYKNRDTIKDPARLSAWLATTAKREALRLKRRNAQSISIDALPDPADPGELPDDSLLRIEQQAKIETAIGLLDERCRYLMDLIFFGEEKLSYEQIAGKMGFSSNALGPARRRCLERLRKILTECGYLDARNDAPRTL